MYLLSRDSIPLAVSADKDPLRHYSTAAERDRWTTISDDLEISDAGFEIFPIKQL
jgi:hypothetical protein